MDWYLEQRERLKGQPKRTIAEYVESNGVLVPRRFDNLKEARSSSGEVIVRSEHEQDYDGVSGLLASPKLKILEKAESEEELKEIILTHELYPKESNQSENYIRRHCNFLRIDFDKFRKGISYSFWEFINGVNVKVVADSSIKERYHIITKGYVLNGEFSYSVFDKGKGLNNSFGEIPRDFDLMRITEEYEKIRQLPRFDKSNCPIMEFEFFNGRNYFLQYLRTRTFCGVDFELEPENKGLERAEFVRGATDKKGLVLRINAFYGNMDCMDLTKFDEEASFDLHYDYRFSEIMAKKRKAQLLDSKGDIYGRMLNVAINHTGTSKLFKPEISVYMNILGQINDEELREAYLKSRENNTIKGFDFYVVSDGKNAFLKRVN